MHSKPLCIVALCTLTLVACGGKNGSTPTAPSTPTPATPSIVSLTGTVRSNSGAGISGASVRITDGANAGRSTATTSSGAYSLTGLTPSNANVFVSAGCYADTGKGVYINGTNSLDFTMDPAPAWSAAGSGDTVFDMPTCVARVRIVGRYTGYSSNFIVKVGGRLLVNELLGTGWGPTVYDGTLLTGGGGVTQITNSSGVSWSFTEVKQ